MVFLLTVACERASDSPRDASAQDAFLPADAGLTAPKNVLVERVVDGDTLILSTGRSVRAPDNQRLDGARVRLIGVDTPEISRDSSPGECFGEEARRFTRSRVEGRVVQLEYDFTTGLRDTYGRILAYVAVDGQVLNEALVREGYARVFRSFRFRNRNAYLNLEAAARGASVGLWSACP